ncbi:MAG: right-handed parallel beta-helix repeat-containing protein [Sedimentisphaerales bacterium]
MKRAILSSLAILLIATIQAQAETRLVPADYATIQQAIDGSNDGDVIIVDPGTYPENINFSGKNIVVSSTNPEDPEIVAATIIDGQGRGSVVVFENGETSQAMLAGFTITGGYGTKDTTMPDMNYLYWGAGVCIVNASPTIKCNVITGNTGQFNMASDDSDQWQLCYGGGIACIQSNAIITKNIIKDNSTYAGGGMMTYLENPKITNNLIYDNSALIGGGVYLLYAGELVNNTIIGNASGLLQPANAVMDTLGGNVYAESRVEVGQCLIVNNIICNAKSGCGIYSQSIEEDIIAFNNVWNNLPGNYLGRDQNFNTIYDGPLDKTGLDGNISQDPLLGDNYRIAANSPCHDAGDPNYIPYPWQRDIDNEYAVMGARVDIGADEVTDNARPVANAGDNQLFDAIVANVTLDGTGSYDFDAGDVISYQWQQVSGSTVVILNPDTPEPNFVPPVEDIFIFELTVFDGSNYSAPDSVMIVVGNRTPFADAGDEQACEPRQEATLDGSASYDLDEGDILSYSWSQVSGPSVELFDPNTQAPRFTPNLIGEYVFELTVNDGADTSLPDTVTVFCRIGSEPDAYGYHWIDSDSTWGPKYNWIDIQETGNIVTGLDYSFEGYVGPFPIGFDFNFYGNIYKQFYVQSNGLISFNAGEITYQNQQIPAADEYNNIIAWMWTYMYATEISKIYYQQFSSFIVIQFVDYEIGFGGSVNAEVKIFKSGKIVIQYKDFSDDAYLYQYTVGIENANGTIGTQAVFNDRYYLHGELAIEFSLGPPSRPVADAGSDQHVAVPQLITLDGSASFIYDPCSVLEYEWDQLVGPAVELTNPTGMHPTFMPEVEGEYRFELVVIGDEDFSEPDEVFILVGNQPPIIDVGPNQVSPVSGRVTLDGTGSYDPDNIDELSYTWTQLEGPEVTLRNADTATPYFICEEEGTYVFELVVTDGFVDSEPRLIEVATVSVTNNQYNLDPGFSTDDYFYYPDVSGSKVVYSVGQFDNYRWFIRCKDLKTGELDEEFLGGGINTQPKIDGDIVVWAAGPFSAGFQGPECIGIFAKNIAAGTEVTLRQYSNTQSYSHPAVSGNKVVWLEHLGINKNLESEWKNTPYSICGADITDLNRPVYFTIAEHVGRRDPYPYEDYYEDFDDVIDISGNIVVYEAEGDIYGADISNINAIKVFTICSDPARQYDPAISGNIVVWTDERNDRGNIYGADISDTGNIKELVIARASGSQQQPDIDGCLIVYIDGGRSYFGQIKVCCLTKQHSVMDFALSGYPYGTSPAINADTIIWQNSNFGEIQGISLEFAYSGFDGSVENLTTGKYYDYIQHAIAAGQAGDTIIAGEGIYNESINFKGKKLTVSSANPDDPAVVAATVINGSGRIVTFSGGEDANSILSGFTITGGSNGIYCTEATPVIADCIITGNNNAGIKLYSGGSPTITNCSIVANSGAGVEMYPRKTGRFTFYNRPQISNSIVAANGMQGIFGGIPAIANCTIVENLRGGIYGSRPIITNSIIYFNGNAQIAESTATVTYSDVQGSWPGLGNIDADPLFADPDNCDYHLKSKAGRWDPGSQTWVEDDLTSPCIDKGDPGTPVGDEPVPNGGIINMGAYGGTAQASMTFSE